MDMNKMTQKSIQAVQDCQKIAYEYGNQRLDQAHLLLALLRQDDSLIFRLLRLRLKLSTEPMPGSGNAASS